MLEMLSAILFLLVAAGTAWAGFRAGAWRARSLHRLAPVRAPAATLLPSPTLLWRELVSRIGSAVPAAARDLAASQAPPDPRRDTQPERATLLPGHPPGHHPVIRRRRAARGLAIAIRRPERDPGAAAAGAALGYAAPMQYLLFRIRRRQHAIARGLPNALDLMVVCVEAGLGIDQTTLQVAKELQSAHPEICSEFTVMNLELRAGKRRAEALHNLADRAGVEDLRKLVAVLVQTDRFGTSIAQSLRGHADYLRAMARQRAEERASKLAVKLVFPIFFCVLPAAVRGHDGSGDDAPGARSASR